MRVKRLRKSILMRYLASYTSVVLLVCFSLGMLLLIFSTNQMLSAELDIYRGRLTAAANDLEQQFKAMEDILVDMKTKVVYQPFYLMRNAVYDLELIDAFSRYTSYTPLAEEYYLWYRETDAVYGRSSRYSFDVFSKYVMKGAPEESLRGLLTADIPVSFAKMPERQDALLIAMPLHIGSRNDPQGACTMLFSVHLDTLWQRIKNMADVTPETGIAVAYRGQEIAGGLDGGAETLIGISQEGMISLAIPRPSTEMFKRLSSFRSYAILCIAVMAVLFTVVASFAAYRNYIPIKRLHQKFGEPGGKQTANEIQQIEETLSRTLELNKLSRQQIDRQVVEYNRYRGWLKQQFMMMLLAGEYNEEFDRRMLEMGFEMPHPLFAVLFVHITGGEVPERLMELMESFSDEDMVLYAAELKEKEKYAVLANFMDRGALPDIVELLKDGFLAKELAVSIYAGETCQGLSSIAMAALNALRLQPVYASAQKPEAAGRREDKGDTLRLITAIETADEERALDLLQRVVKSIETEYPSHLMRAYMLSSLFMRINSLAHRSGMPTMDGEGDNAYMLNDAQALKGEIVKRVTAICRFLRLEQADQDPSASEKIQEYIRSHALDSSISLSDVAGAFNISTKQVTRILKSSIGITFKAYLIQLRMEAAKQLLGKRDASIAATAERVGYYNISHFIRSFREYTGITPGEYKKYFE